MVESKRNTIRRGFVHELLHAQDTVLCSYFAERMGTKKDGWDQFFLPHIMCITLGNPGWLDPMSMRSHIGQD